MKKTVDGTKRAYGYANQKLEGDPKFHPIERKWLIIGWILILLYAFLYCYYIFGAGYIIIIFAIALTITILAAWIFVKIPMHKIIEVNHDPTKVMDTCRIHDVPMHELDTAWELVGNVPPLINMTDGGWVYFAENVDTYNRVIYQTELKGASSVDFLTTKDLFKEVRKALIWYIDRYERLEKNLPLIVMRKLGFWIKRFEISVLSNEKIEYAQYYAGQSHDDDGEPYKDTIPVSMIGGDPDDMPEDNKEDKEYKAHVRGLLNKENAQYNSEKFKGKQSSIRKGMEVSRNG